MGLVIEPYDDPRPPRRHWQPWRWLMTCTGCGVRCRATSRLEIDGYAARHGRVCAGKEAPMSGAWRTGRKVGRTIYRGDELVGVMDDAGVAARVVALLNRDDDVTALADAVAGSCRRVGDAVVCGPGPVVPDTTSDCPNREQHTPRPAGIVDFQDWADAMTAAGARQERCPVCRRWTVWTEPERKVEWP